MTDRRSLTESNQEGTILVFFAALAVGLFGLLGVVLDGGRLRTTKQQMDAGAEIAALEGLRFRDAEGDGGRRGRARDALDLLWDDDFDVTNGDRLGLGAGPLPVVFEADPLAGRLGVANARGDRYWKPGVDLQDNAVNAAHGDLVAGSYLPGAGEPMEDDAFVRNDFAPTAGDPVEASAFLVRLRRTRSRLALDRDPGVSSSGPPFEWLWARGSAWEEPGPDDIKASRNDGLTVRSTAIAASERALVVSAVPDSVGLAPFALRGDAGAAWTSTGVGAALILDVDPSGSLVLAGVEQGISVDASARAVGATLVPIADPGIAPPIGDLLVPVYGLGTSTIAAFTLATATRSGTTLTLVRQPGAVLPAGASAVSPAALGARVALAADPALQALHVSHPEPALAPVLRR